MRLFVSDFLLKVGAGGIQNDVVPFGWISIKHSNNLLVAIKPHPSCPISDDQVKITKKNEDCEIILGRPTQWIKNEDTVHCIKNDGSFNVNNKEELKELGMSLSGSFSVLFIKNDCWLLVTDKLGTIPIYYYKAQDFFVIGSLDYTVKELSHKSFEKDLASIGELILTGRIIWPYSIWRNINVAPAALFCQGHYKTSILEFSQYWLPVEPKVFLRSADIAHQIKLQVFSEINAVLSAGKTPQTFLSGGSDSRVIAAMTRKLVQEKEIKGYFIGEFRNREWQLAKRAAWFYKINLSFLSRSSNLYLEGIKEKTGVLGFSVDALGAHLWEISNKINPVSPIFGGLMGDGLLRGNRHPSAKRSLMGIQVGGTTLNPFSVNMLKRVNLYGALHPWLQEEIQQRFEQHLSVLRKLRPQTYSEWVHLWPLGSCHQDMAFYHYNRRLLNSFEPFFSNAVVNAARDVNPLDRVSGDLFRESFGKTMGLGGYWPRSSGWIPKLSWRGNLLIMPISKLLLKIFSNKKALYQSPWPDYGTLLEDNWEDCRLRVSNSPFASYLIKNYSAEIFKSDKMHGIDKMRLWQTLNKLNQHDL